MVSASDNGGDGIVRNVQYASFRKDKAPSEGYSAELISNRVQPEFYDNLVGQFQDPNDTFLKLFRRNATARPNEPFLGTRTQLENNA